MASSTRPKRPKAPPPRLNLEEMEHDPSMKGMLSFLEITPAEKLALLQKRAQVDASFVIPFPAQPDSVETTATSGPPATVSVEFAPTVSERPPTTVIPDSSAMVSGGPVATVAPLSSATVVERPSETIAAGTIATPIIRPADTVAVVSTDTPASTRLPGGLWWTEGKEGIFAAPRVRRIARAQDALTHAEESVYDVLWGPRNQSRDSQRFADLGYDAIARAARVTKMNAKFIVERLIFKGFARVERLPDPLRRIPTRYCVFSYRAALDDMARRHRQYVVRTGNGVLFAHPLTPTDTVSAAYAARVGVDSSATVSGGQKAMGAPGQPDTVAAAPATTVSAAATHSDIKTLDMESAAAPAWPLAARALFDSLGHGDDDALRMMAEAALRNASDASDEELAHFIREEAPRVKRNRSLENPMGALIRQVPRRFLGESLRISRAERRRCGEAAAAESREMVALARRVLADPASLESDLEWARALLDEG